MILEIQDILVSSDIITENFCCDLSKCRGRCCIEGEAGAPVTLDEIGEIEDNLDKVEHLLSPEAKAVIEKQGVAYIDPEGCLVTSIVNGKDCAFTKYDDITVDKEKIENCCLCAFQGTCKPISCYLYPIREKTFNLPSLTTGGAGGGSVTAITYQRWDICKDAIKKGNDLQLPVYRFLKEPLIRRFGQEWYDELCLVAEEIKDKL